jgi:translocation and assembly module TamB
MTRFRRIAPIVAGAIAGLVPIVVLAGIVIVQTQWFRNFVRAKIVSAVEDATGGSTEIGQFSFDWRHLRAQVRDFTIHGLEPRGSAPLFHAELVQVDLKLLSPFKGFVDIAYLLLDTPKANVMVYGDGHTNIPAPKAQAKSSNKSGLETIVDLAIGRFDLRNGNLTFGDAKTSFSASGANFRAQLGYNALHPSYTGEIDISPLRAISGGNRPLDVNVRLPVTALKDRIELKNAQFDTAKSHIVLSGAMDRLIAPRTSGHLQAQVSLDDVRRATGLTDALDLAHGPRVLAADVAASMDPQSIRIQSARVSLGRTSIEASGVLRDASGGGGAQLTASLDLDELGRLLRVAARPQGQVKLGGTARLDASNNYSFAGNVEARRVALRQGGTEIANVSLDSNVTADSQRIALADLRLEALGGRFAGSASLQEMSEFQFAGRLQGYEIEQIARTFLQRSLDYNGVLSGPVEANGSIKDMASLAARINLNIAPGGRKATGVPVTGHLNADYNARADSVTLGASYIALPHTRIDLNGQLGKQIQVKLVSRSLADFQPLGAIPLTLDAGGAAMLTATVSGKLSSPKIAGDVAVNNFSAQGRPFTRFAADLTASPSNVVLTNALVTHGALQMQLSASAGLREWKLLPASPLRADATIRNADLKDVLALAGESTLPISGAFTADAHIAGTVGSPAGTVDASAVTGTLYGEKFDAFTLQARMAEQTVTVPSISLVAGAARLDANVVFRHPPNDLQQGTVTGHVSANRVQLAQFASLLQDRPGLSGAISLNADATANLRAGDFTIATVNGNLAARGLAMEGKTLGDLTATANSSGAALMYNVSSDFAGSSIRITGQSELAGDHRTSANASISNLPLDRVLAMAGRRDLPVTGVFGATAQVSGTLQDPHATANVTLANASVYDEPFTRLQADVNYTSRSIDVPRFHMEDGASYIDANVSLTHPAGDLEDGDVRFHVNSNQIQLARVRAIQHSQPTLGGSAQITADGAARLRKNATPLLSTLNASLRATGLTMNRQNLGDLTATAATKGTTVDFNLTSDLAHSNLKGSGSLQLTSDYPVNARLSFSHVTYRALSPLLSSAPPPPFDAELDGEAAISGPVTDTAQLRGTLTLTKLEAHSTAATTLGAQPRVNLDLKNSGNIVAALDRGKLTVQNFRLTGHDVDLTVTGSASIAGQRPLGLKLDGKLNLEILEAFSSEIYSSGAVTLNAAIDGTAASPDITGKLQLQKASFNMIELPNGLSNATGTVIFNGANAYIQNITGESGGGKVTLAGTVAYAGPQVQFRAQATASGVHIQYPDTITTQVDANLTVNGTSSSSLVTGTVSITDVALHSGADIGNVLTAAAAPPSSPTASGGALAGMRFDVRVTTAPDVQFRTTLTQNLQADANLTLLGTPDNPGMIGRVTITAGDVVFFGNKYTIDQGAISFSNPAKIDPILNIDLETTVQGVDVSLTVSGPVNKMKFSYRSDPPLQFQQIVSLLASGTTPTTDPVLAAHQPAAPQQSLEQSGASALVGQAVANPVSGRLQRLFGVSKLSIDPQIVGTTNTAQATLTLQQQITRDLTFTYIQDVTQSNPQIVRAEWTINPQYSAVAMRDVNGEFTLSLFYKKRFH